MEKLGFIAKEEWDKKGGGGGEPIGFIGYFSSNTAPDGYLICDGAEISRTFYKELFDVIGTTYGAGDGSTTFNIPNLIDKFAQGSKTVGTVNEAGLPNITGTVACYTYNTGSPSGAFSVGSINPAQAPSGTATDRNFVRNNFNASNSSSVYGKSTTVQPPALTLLPCIKAVNIGTPTETDIKGIAALIMDTFFPVGSYAFGVKPSLGTWEEVEGDRALWLKNTVADGTEIEQALPNITGAMRFNSQGAFTSTEATAYAKGALTTGAGLEYTLVTSGTTNPWTKNNNGKELALDASKSSSIYKDGANVQPNAYVMKVFKRIA